MHVFCLIKEISREYSKNKNDNNYDSDDNRQSQGHFKWFFIGHEQKMVFATALECIPLLG
jgi:hypothetical protein